MKDRDLRSVVRLLAERVNYLNDELKTMKENHPEGCRCRLCKPRANPFARSFISHELKELLDDE